jgi:hypothetical protein
LDEKAAEKNRKKMRKFDFLMLIIWSTNLEEKKPLFIPFKALLTLTGSGFVLWAGFFCLKSFKKAFSVQFNDQKPMCLILS